MKQATKQRRAIRRKRRHYTDIPRDVKLTVWERDRGACIYCKGKREEYISSVVNGVKKMASAIYNPQPNAHYVPRSKGGLGIEENIVTLCFLCHHDYDNGKDSEKRKDIDKTVVDHLKNHYGSSWSRERLIYSKYRKED